MHRNEGHDCYPTLEQFKHFQREVAGQMEHLKNIMEIQHKQIDLLTSNRQQNSREITEAVLKNEEIEQENKLLRLKIQELESAIQSHHSEIVRLKNHLQSNKNGSPHLPDPQQKVEEHHRQLNLDQPTPTPHSQIQSLKKIHSDDSAKYLVDNRRTKDNEEALEDDDDEEEIQCVWYASQKKDKPTQESHQHNPQAKEFTATRNDDCLSITKVNGYGFFSSAHSFIHKDCIPAHSVSRYQVKRVKVRDIFLFGICTRYIFGVENAFRHREAIAYSSNGYAWLNGDSTKGGKQLKANQTIEMLVDRPRGTVSWLINDTEMIKIHIPHHMVSQQLYLVLMMFNKEDNLHLYSNTASA